MDVPAVGVRLLWMWVFVPVIWDSWLYHHLQHCSSQRRFSLTERSKLGLQNAFPFDDSAKFYRMIVAEGGFLIPKPDDRSGNSRPSGSPSPVCGEEVALGV